LGRHRFPEVLDAPYFLSLGPYDFYWLALERPQAAGTAAERPVLAAKSSWTALLDPSRRAQLARTLLGYAILRRWFRGKARTRKQVSISDVLTFEADPRHAIVLLQVEYDHGRPETYVVPIAFVEDSDGADPAHTGLAHSSGLVIARVALTDVAERGSTHGVLYDAVCSEAFCAALLGAMLGGGGATGRVGRLTGDALAALRDAIAAGVPLAARAMAVDQSNSSVLYGDRFLLKLFRVIEDGPSSELEIGRFFAGRGPDHRGVPRLAGVLEYRQSSHEPCTLGTLFEYVPNQGDAWRLAMDEIDRYYDRVLTDEHHPEAPVIEPGSLVERARLPLSDRVVDLVGPFLDHIRLLGRRTAELHLQLAAAIDDPMFAPEPYDILHQQSMYGTVVANAARTFDLLRSRLASLHPEQRALAEVVLAREPELDRVLAQITRRRIDVVRTRTHGDYHLGQVLWTGDDFVIIDFEGEPGRPLSQRRFKHNPLRDVAGMLESLRYAGVAELRSGRHRPEDVARLEPWARAWSGWMSAAFLGGYCEAARGSRILPRSDADLGFLLEFFVLEKCVYEIGYELNNRPDWLEIPMRAMLALVPGAP
jgi:maltose alpha-D-glucosyltransferase/alpha-amylase